MELTNKQYCVYLNNWPFINNAGKLSMCCKNSWTEVSNPYATIKNTSLKELWESVYIQYQRDKLARNEMPRGCEVCFDHENKINELSFRNRSLLGVKKKCDNVKPNDPMSRIPYHDKIIRALDLRVGSTCNLACVMCHPSDSSKWYSMYEDYFENVLTGYRGIQHVNYVKSGTKPSLLNWAEHDSSWENIYAGIDSNLRKIYLAGGEPFYIKKFPEYVSELVEYANDAEIDINTNGTCRLHQKHLDKLAGKLNLRISIDGYGVAESYQRLGTNWEEKVAVMDEYTKYFNITSFDITITSLTIRNIPELIEFLTERYPGVKIMLRPVVNRPGLTINEIPDSLRVSTLDKFLNYSDKMKENFNNLEQLIFYLQKAENFEHKNMLVKTVNYWNKVSGHRLEDYDSELSNWILS